jgi:hypothetical protein
MKAPDTMAGKAIKCPKCQAVVKIPGGAARPAAPTQKPTPAPNVAGRAAAGKTLPAKQAPLDDLEEINEKTAPKMAGTKVASAELSDDLKEEVDGELTTGERIIYIGQPVPRVVFMRGLWYLIIGGVLATVAAGWVGYSFIKGVKMDNMQEVIMALMPLILVFVGIGCVIAPFSMRRRAHRDVYLLTNRRAVVWTQKFFSRKKEVYQPTQLVQMRSEGSWAGGGVGDVIFKTVVRISISNTGGRRMGGGYVRGGRTNVSRSVTHYGFLAVPEYKAVDRLIRETLVDKVLDKMAKLNQLDDEE